VGTGDGSADRVPQTLEISRWCYDGPYAFYDFDHDPDDLAELLASAIWPDRYFAALVVAVFNQGKTLFCLPLHQPR